MMSQKMFSSSKNNEILKSIIKNISIDMMDLLISLKKATQMFFHDDSMLFNISTIVGERMGWKMNMPVSVSMSDSIFPCWMGVPGKSFSTTFFRTKMFCEFFNQTLRDVKYFPTAIARNIFAVKYSLLHDLTISLKGVIVKSYFIMGMAVAS